MQSVHSRLPIQHPEFRYSLSLNPYCEKLKAFSGRAFSDHDTEAHAGQWRTRFPDAGRHSAQGPKRPLHVEIGCNGGHVILEWAARSPNDAFIGLDWKFKQIHRGAEKAAQRKLNNLIFFRAHAERLRYMFAPGEIDHLYVYFPDPWPKKSQRKNRFISAGNLKMLAALVREGGTFHIKTDHAEYFEWMEKSVQEAGDAWRVAERTNNLHRNHPDPKSLQIPEVTIFEKVFIKQGIPINSLRLARTNAPAPFLAAPQSE